MHSWKHANVRSVRKIKRTTPLSFNLGSTPCRRDCKFLEIDSCAQAIGPGTAGSKSFDEQNGCGCAVFDHDVCVRTEKSVLGHLFTLGEMRPAFRDDQTLIHATNHAPSNPMRTPINGLNTANQNGIVSLKGIASLRTFSVSTIGFIRSAYCSDRPLRLGVCQVWFQNRIAGSHKSCS